MNRTPEQIHDHSYFISNTTNEHILKVRKNGTFFELVDVALHRLRPLHWADSLPSIYSDLLDAWQIALQSMPITMHEATFGETCLFWEKHVFPSLNAQAVRKSNNARML